MALESAYTHILNGNTTEREGERERERERDRERMKNGFKVKM